MRRYLSLTPPEMCRKATHSGEVVRGQNPGGKMAPRCEGRDTGEKTGAPGERTKVQVGRVKP